MNGFYEIRYEVTAKQGRESKPHTTTVGCSGNEMWREL